MTFLDFKKFAIEKNIGGLSLPQDNAGYTPLIQDSLEYIAKLPNCIPIDLIESDLSKPRLRFLTVGKFIRKPIAPTNDTDTIDIDEQLVYAVAYDFLFNHTKDPINLAKFEKRRDEEVTNFNWNNFAILQDLGV